MTTERDLLRKITRMPTTEFRLWEEDIIPEEGHEKKNASIKSSQLQESELADDYYDDFVIVERLDVEKYNDEKKLEEEEKIKDSGKS